MGQEFSLMNMYECIGNSVYIESIISGIIGDVKI